MTLTVIGPDAEARLDWIGLTEALTAGHSLPVAEVTDGFLYRGSDTVLNRAAWIDGLGIAVKTATIFPGNTARGKASVDGGVMLYDDAEGHPVALLDFKLVTKWKTAGDSLLSALRLAPPNVETILIVGAGTVAASLIEAYGAGFPDARFEVWNRTRARAEPLAGPRVRVVDDLPAACARADIIATATMATAPVIEGAWLTPGTHLDLIGAYRPDMREVDDATLRRARVFVDSRKTTMGHIGEIEIPLQAGALSPEDILADFYDLPSGRFARQGPEEITLAKNGGGAHLDLMTARYILDAVRG